MNHKLAKAISMAIAGVAMSAGASGAMAGTTMYNTFNAFAAPTATDGSPTTGGQPTTDGWVYGTAAGVYKGTAPGAGTPSFVGIGGSSSASSSTPFGYAGGAILNWAAQLGGGDSVTISQADSFARYGVYADIDVAKGSWSDASRTTTGASGWKHNTDFGLFQSSVDTQVNLSAVGVKPDLSLDTANAFGFTIFKGMDASTTAYGHHGAWNAGNNSAGITASSLVPGTSFTTSDIVAYSVGAGAVGAATQNISNISFNAQAGQVYTIVMGGYQNGAWNFTAEGYQLAITTVPVPGAVWLFGSAVAGLVGFGRRKTQAAA